MSNAIYGIRVKWKDGRNEIKEFGTSKRKRNSEIRKLNRNSKVEEAVPFTST